MRKKIFIIVFLFFAFIKGIHATCSYSTIARLKTIISNVNYSYSYTMEEEYPNFRVTVNNITPDIYFIDNNHNMKYEYSDTLEGEIILSGYNSGSIISLTFYSADFNCYGQGLYTSKYSLPNYNKYYLDDICNDAGEYYMCQKWSKNPINYDSFYNSVYEYKKSKTKSDTNETEKKIIVKENTILDYILSFYIKYYYFILGFVIATASYIIFRYNKKNKFEL